MSGGIPTSSVVLDGWALLAGSSQFGCARIVPVPMALHPSAAQSPVPEVCRCQVLSLLLPQVKFVLPAWAVLAPGPAGSAMQLNTFKGISPALGFSPPNALRDKHTAAASTSSSISGFAE